LVDVIVGVFVGVSVGVGVFVKVGVVEIKEDQYPLLFNHILASNPLVKTSGPEATQLATETNDSSVLNFDLQNPK
jgi:hypothetical protein